MNKYTIITVLAVVGALFASTYLVEDHSFTLITKDEAHLFAAFEAWTLENARHYREDE